jgi:YHS domain-containing protein
MVRGMLRLIYYLTIAYLIYAVVRFFQNLSKRSEAPKSRPRLSGMMVKDEACNTYVPKEEALREVIDGQEYFFCSKDCQKKFLEQRKRPN